jgi:RNA polymerase sigma-70 factor (ECF subfamily)
MTMDEGVEEAVRRVRRGDRAAYRVVVETHQAGVRAAIAAHGIPPADVDDLAQDTFLFAYQRLSDYQPGTSLGSWLKTIGRFKAMAWLDAARREAKNQRSALRRFLDEQSDREAGADLGPWGERLEHCLGELTRRQSGIVRQRYSGVPLASIAAELSVSEDAVKMLLLRIRRALRRCLEGGA